MVTSSSMNLRRTSSALKGEDSLIALSSELSGSGSNADGSDGLFSLSPLADVDSTVLVAFFKLLEDLLTFELPAFLLLALSMLVDADGTVLVAFFNYLKIC